MIRYQDPDGDDFHRINALFVDNDRDLKNLARCLYFFFDPCVSEYPAEGEVGLAGVDLSFYTEMISYDAGDPLTVGGVDLSPDPSHEDWITYYVAEPDRFGDDSEISIGGELTPFAGDVLAFPDRIEMTAPPMGSRVAVGPASVVSLAWEAPGEGEVYLTHDETIWHLADNGSFDLEIDGLGFTPPLDHGTLYLDRQLNTEVDANGNTVRVETLSRQLYHLDYSDLTHWTALATGGLAAETCGQATLQPSIPAGQYHGDLAGLNNDHDLADRVEGIPFSSQGSDLVAGIDLQAGEQLRVEGRQVLGDLVLMLYDAGCDPAYPLAYADAGFTEEDETLTYDAAVDQTVYLVIDGYEDGGLFYVSVEIDA